MKKIWTDGLLFGHKAYMSFAAIFMSAVLTVLPASAGTIKYIKASDDGIVVTFDDIVEGASTFSLSGPNRIAVDIKGATAGHGGAAFGLVTAVRQGQHDPHTARVVLELDRPAIITGGSFSANGRELKLKYTKSSPDRLAKGRKSFLPPAAFRADPPKSKYSVKVPLGKAKDDVNLPKVHGPADKSRPLVVIDAGHGGHDPGAISPHANVHEKQVTLAIAKAIRDRLVANGRVRVALTRETDKFLVLQERYGIARRLKADLFISIHADAAGSESASGATVYTLSEVASDREASKLAARENKANIINGINLGGANQDVSSILIDLTQRETMNVSADFAKLLHREGSKKQRFRSNPHRFASFVVLKAPDTPSILFETGYLTNKRDIEFLGSAAGRRKVAEGVANAVEVHFARKLAGK